MQSALEKKKKRFRELYELLFADYRIKDYRISEKLGFRSASAVVKEAVDQMYIVGPEIRRCSYRNTLEYVHIFNAEDPDITYWKYCGDPNVIYHAGMAGFGNSFTIFKEGMDVDGKSILEGPRSDYYVPFTPHQSWEQALKNMRGKIEKFDPDEYIPKGFIKNHWNETVKWDDIDEVLYRYFKYDLRKKAGQIIREQQISKNIIYHWLETLDKRCTVQIEYYPETLPEYDTYFYMFETEYEDFIVELFSELPATGTFFKVADTLLLMAYIPRRFMKNIDLREAEKWFIPLLERELLDKGIVKKKKRAAVDHYCGKEL